MKNSLPLPDSVPPLQAIASAPLSRRGLFGMAAGLLMCSISSRYAWADPIYAWSNRSAMWNAPTITYLSQNSNLFKPGDRPRSDVVATCIYVNTEPNDDRTLSYWGMDCGLTYEGDAQRDWPKRTHSYGEDCFDYEQWDENDWYGQYTDSFTGAYLPNNLNGGREDDEGTFHIVSYARWDISDFGGGVIPTESGSWNLHNHTGWLTGDWGYYQASDNPGGVRPPDACCVWEKYSAWARITVFSVENIASGSDYRLRYCMYVFIAASDVATVPIDNYAGTVWSETLAAGISCHVDVLGFGNAARRVATNAYRALLDREPTASELNAAQSAAESGTKNLAEIVRDIIGNTSWQSLYSTSFMAIVRLMKIFTVDASLSIEGYNNWMDYLENNGLAQTAYNMMKVFYSQNKLGYAIEVPRFSVTIAGADVAGTEHSVICDASGNGKTGRVYMRGTYSATLYNPFSAWSISPATATVTIPDSGSGLYFPLTFTANANMPAEVAARKVSITFMRDYEACLESDDDPTCYSDRASVGQEYTPPEAADKAGHRTGCESWSGWFTDSACTKPYTPKTLTGGMTLFCKSYVRISWELSTKSRVLATRYAGLFSPAESLEDAQNLEEFLPEETVVAWRDTYSIPALPTVYWPDGDRTLSADGQACYDNAGTKPASGDIIVAKNISLYGDWPGPTYDGIASQ